MRALVVVENISLDGVMQAPGRHDEDTRGGFEHGGWASELMRSDPVAARASMERQAQTEVLLFGHRTYLDLVGHWLTTDEPNPFTEVIANTPKFVASHGPCEQLPFINSSWLSGDVMAEVAQLKQNGDGDIVVLGSGVLVRDLAAAGLVDRYLLTILPMVIGSGTRLFGDTYTPLEVEQAITTPTGIVVATYLVRQ